MSAPIYVVGHKNPDNDSISAAVAYSNLKNELARREAAISGEDPDVFIPVRLGPLPPESAQILEENGIDAPIVLSHISARVSDIMQLDPQTINLNDALLDAARKLRVRGVSALVVVDDDGLYKGLVTRRMMGEMYLAATDALDSGESELAVASRLLGSLAERVEAIVETDVLVLNKDDKLNEAASELLDSELREGIVLDEEGRAIGFLTPAILAVRPKRRVILVDHNETRQAIDGIEEADVMEVIDHHRIADVSTSNPIKFLNLPVGSTATIVAMEYERYGVEITKEMASVMLSAIMTDTVILKSPTTTETDRVIADRLAKIVGMDAVQFGMKVFKMRGDDSRMPVEKLVGADSKEFALADGVCLIAQHETVDLPTILGREQEIREHMRHLQAQGDYEFVLLMITDILAEGSQLFCEGDRTIVNNAFDINCTGEGGVWMPGVLSRKKQVAARVLA